MTTSIRVSPETDQRIREAPIGGWLPLSNIPFGATIGAGAYQSVSGELRLEIQVYFEGKLWMSYPLDAYDFTPDTHQLIRELAAGIKSDTVSVG